MLPWKQMINDYVIPLTSINFDCIMGIQCNLANNNPLYILGVYLPYSSHNIDEFCEYFDHLWALYDSLSGKGFVVLMGHFNGHLGNSLGDKSTRESNQRGLKLLEFANYFNLCQINLSRLCDGPTDFYHSHGGRYCSTLDYIVVPNYMLNSIYSGKTFGISAENEDV